MGLGRVGSECNGLSESSIRWIWVQLRELIDEEKVEGSFLLEV